MALNRVFMFQGKRFLVGSRDSANKFVRNYREKKTAGADLRPEEEVAGVLSVGDFALDAISEVYGPQDFTHTNLAGKTDLTIDPVGQKRQTQHQKLPKKRLEVPQTCDARRRTMLSAMFTAQAAFMHKPTGVFIIHCEHGLHRSPAYFYAIAAKMLAERITLDHFDKATNADKTLTLNKSRLIKAARSVLWGSLGKPEPGTANDPNAYSPYPRIMRVGEKVTMALYDGLKPLTPREQRDAQVTEKAKKLLEGPG